MNIHSDCSSSGHHIGSMEWLYAGLHFDILDTKSTMITTENVAVSEVYPWSAGQARNTMKLRRSIIDTEADGKLDWAPTAQAFHSRQPGREECVRWYRGHRVMPYAGTVYLTVFNSSNLVKAANWAKHVLFVTRQHDIEPRSSHPYQSQDVANPPINFDDFFNGESLVQEDIVVWFNLGMHHVSSFWRSAQILSSLRHIVGFRSCL